MLLHRSKISQAFAQQPCYTFVHYLQAENQGAAYVDHHLSVAT